MLKWEPASDNPYRYRTGELKMVTATQPRTVCELKQMTPEEQYFYDVNGYLVVENAIEPDLLRRILEWTAPLEAEARERIERMGPGENREYIFEDILNTETRLVELVANPTIVPYLNEMIECPRLKSTWLTYKLKHGRTGAHSNHTPTRTCDYYHFNGRIYHNLFQVFYALDDIGPGEGALQVIPGSHKANFPLPENDAFVEKLCIEVHQPRGSALLFSHDCHHRSYNHSDKMRKTLIFTYCPGVIANSYGTDALYERLFEESPEHSWQKYLLRSPNGYRETYPCPVDNPWVRQGAPKNYSAGKK